MPLISVSEAILRFGRGEMLIMVDDENRENEGDFVIPAQFATPEAVNVMIKDGRGMVCVVLGEDTASRLGVAVDGSAEYIAAWHELRRQH